MRSLIDSSVWIHSLRRAGSKKIQELIRPLIVNGEAGITEWIVLELMTGLRGAEAAENLLRKLEPLPQLPFQPKSWRRAWLLAADLRRKGATVAASDCFIAAIALEYDVPLIHCDSDFELIATHTKLRTVDWTGFVN